MSQETSGQKMAHEDVTKFDFQEFQRLDPAFLENMPERFRGLAQRLAFLISSYLGITIDLEFDSVEKLQTADEDPSDSDDGCVVTLENGDEELFGFWWLGQDTVTLLLDLLLGGAGVDTAPLERPLSAVEKPLLRNLLAAMTQQLAVDPDVIPGIEVALGEIESSNDCSEKLTDASIVTVIFNLNWKDNSHPLRLVLPSHSMCPDTSQPIEEDGQKKDNTAVKRARWLAKLEHTNLQAEVSMGELSAEVGDLLSLQVGDVLVFEGSKMQPAELLLNGTPCFAGQPTVHKGLKAISQIQPIKR